MPMIEISRELDAPAEAIFAILADHARFDRFPGVRESELTRQGETEPNGVGAQRRLKVGNSELWEDIVGFEPGRLIEYRIVRIRPPIVRHILGRQRIEALEGGRCRVHWTSEFEPAIPLIGRWLIRPVKQQFEKGFQRMLSRAEALAQGQ